MYTIKTVFFRRLCALNEDDKNKLTILNIYKILSFIPSLHLSLQLLVHPFAALVPSSANTRYSPCIRFFILVVKWFKTLILLKFTQFCWI